MSRSIAAGAFLAALAIGLAGCSSPTPAVEPVTVSAQSLQGRTIVLPIDSELNITTGSQSVTDYTGSIAKPSIARFVAGKQTSSAQFDPSITPLKVGVTGVTLSTKDGSGQYVTFTLDVVKKKGASTPAS